MIRLVADRVTRLLRGVPRHHFGIERRLDHWRDTDDLPGYRTEKNPNVVDRWMNTIDKLPD